jgi:osmoprotectant transport system permease protein
MLMATSPLIEAWLSADFWEQTRIFLSLVLGALGLALLAGIPLGVLLSRFPRLAAPIIAVLALLQTFPSLALLGLLIPLLGIGQPAAIFLAVVYSLFPIVMNTYVGITQVSPAIRDAAKGMGMTGLQILWNVDLPLGLPVVLAGVRTGAIYAVGVITISALAGAGGLGIYLVRGMNRGGDNLLIAIGAIPLLVLTLIIFWGLGGLAWLSRKDSRLGLVLGGGLILVLAAVGLWVMADQLGRRGGGDAPPPLVAGEVTIRIASKNFVEGEILTEICKQMLEAHTDFRVQTKPNLAPNVIFKGLKNGDYELYPEYTGVLLTSREALDLSVPEDKSTITTIVRQGMLDKHRMVLLETFGLNNTYVFCVPKKLASSRGLRTISDLKRFPSARIVVDLDFLDRPDGWKGLVKTYGLDLPTPTLVSPDLRYQALLNKSADVLLGFATDWEIAAHDLAVLEDDRHYFPSYHGAPLVREVVLKHYPEIATVLNRLGGQIDDATMRQLNFAVAKERRSERDVVRAFLHERGLLKRAGR